MTRYKNVN
uniref:Uncharacterized protein n=1 Tax=Anguilla anguilla TaxID=7936 RepID=A0A0E9TSF9_ANGAN